MASYRIVQGRPGQIEKQMSELEKLGWVVIPESLCVVHNIDYSILLKRD